MQNQTALYSIECCGYQNEFVPNGGFQINWNGTAGFGVMNINFDQQGRAHIYSEYMCSPNDKLFAYNAVKRMIDEAIVEE